MSISSGLRNGSPTIAHSFQVTFDAHDPAALAAFWSLALGYIEQPPPPGFDTWQDFASANNIPEEDWNNLAAVVDPTGEGPRLLFQKVPEGKTAKNRVHLDVNVADRGGELKVRKSQIENHVAKLLEAGAARVETFERVRDWGTELWVVMQDPEGNEFCVQ